MRKFEYNAAVKNNCMTRTLTQTRDDGVTVTTTETIPLTGYTDEQFKRYTPEQMEVIDNVNKMLLSDGRVVLTEDEMDYLVGKHMEELDRIKELLTYKTRSPYDVPDPDYLSPELRELQKQAGFVVVKNVVAAVPDEIKNQMVEKSHREAMARINNKVQKQNAMLAQKKKRKNEK